MMLSWKKKLQKTPPEVIIAAYGCLIYPFVRHNALQSTGVEVANMNWSFYSFLLYSSFLLVIPFIRPKLNKHIYQLTNGWIVLFFFDLILHAGLHEYQPAISLNLSAAIIMGAMYMRRRKHLIIYFTSTALFSLLTYSFAENPPFSIVDFGFRLFTVVGISYLILDISLHRRISETHSTLTYQKMVSGTKDVIALHQKDGAFYEINEAVFETVGYHPKELIGRDVYELVHPEDQKRVQDNAINHILDPTRRSKIRYRFLHKSGEYVWMESHIDTIQNKEGKFKYLLAISHDISAQLAYEKLLEEKRAELDEKSTELEEKTQELEQKTQELEQKTEALEQKTQELEKRNQELQEFAYIISHDLREPLRMVRSFLGLLKQRYKEQLDEQGNLFIQQASEGASRMQKMIQVLLDYSRIKTHGGAFENVSVNLIIEEACENLGLLIQQHHARVTYGDLPVVEGDGMQLVQLFQNLIHNAIKYRRAENPRIHISAEKVEGKWIFALQDNGIGISPSFYQKIFGIFQRLHTRQKYEGSGIGLAICKRIVERHGGEIWLESEEGKGTTFFFSLVA